MKILDKVNYPKDLKNLSIEELNTLSDEIREVLIRKMNAVGGHLGPNLGFVEPTIALHYIFDTPNDKIVYDISHQVYTHKILTGRKDGFIDSNNYYKYSGFSNPDESEYDLFKIGHTSTSISLAVGVAKARDINGGKENVIAVIGDGSLTGGEALEGLNNAAVINSNIIIVVNDNGMSIAENQGGLNEHLQALKDNKGEVKNNLFKALGFDYIYVDNGNNIDDLIKVFKKVKNIDHPVIVHLHTLKGKGLPQAEANKERFHYTPPTFLDNKNTTQTSIPETYSSITADYILGEVKKGNNIVAVSPATPGATSFYREFRDALGEHYVDVGIAEQHAVGYISGIASQGAKPVLAIMSSFIQRSYDQLSQDLALNNSPATILVYYGTISGSDATHLGIFDIPLISNIPNIVYLAPTGKEEYLAMLDWSVNKNKKNSVVIRVPVIQLKSTGIKDNTDYSILNKFKITEQGQDVAIIGVGNFYELGKNVRDELSKKHNINATLINPRYVSGLDKDLLNDLKIKHKLVITLEDGIVEGGFGQKIASFYGNSNIKVINFGADKEFTDSIPLSELYQRYHLTKELIVGDIIESLNN
jgi:1-deoxy-D-xylulose-5-phosphate synthase